MMSINDGQCHYTDDDDAVINCIRLGIKQIG